jgi:hypothetical protein
MIGTPPNPKNKEAMINRKRPIFSAVSLSNGQKEIANTKRHPINQQIPTSLLVLDFWINSRKIKFGVLILTNLLRTGVGERFLAGETLIRLRLAAHAGAHRTPESAVDTDIDRNMCFG